MQPDQDQIFASFEGNRWFQRNKDTLERFNPEVDFSLRLIELYGLRPNTVLEVGAANGFRLAKILERYGARVVAVEPSVEAIRDGKTKFPSVEFVRGQARSIPLRESFALIIINFVFHWIDRANLLRSVAEIDRLVENGGFLIIGDFLPENLVRVQYHHLPDAKVYTYKQNYAEIFLASGLYHTVCMMSADDSSRANAKTTEESRIGVWLLRKSITEHYVEAERNT